MGLTLDLEPIEETEALWDEHLPAWEAWCAVSGQWRSIPLSGFGGATVIWVGLDYAAAQAGLTLAGIAPTPDLWAEVRVIEEGAKKGLNRGR